MSKFIQLHILTSYPASNLNRDDFGRPKTVTMGNATRMRVSSQSLKRAWRTSDIFKGALGGEHVGTRTKEMGRNVFLALNLGLTLAEAIEGKKASGELPTLKEKTACEIGRAVGGVFGKLKPEPKKDADPGKTREALLESMEIEQLAHFSAEEIAGIGALVESCRASGKAPVKEELELLRGGNKAADIAMFGRMIAANTRYNVEAAAQVAHAMTVHKVDIEDDFYTAVDDLNRDDAGAGHMGVTEFGAGLFYLYLCLDRELLVKNLQGDEALAKKAVAALTEAACMVSPTGKQNSFASRAFASFVLAEKGDEQPRNLSVAFLQGLDGKGDLLGGAVEALRQTKANMDKVYGQNPAEASFNAMTGDGSIKELAAFAAE